MTKDGLPLSEMKVAPPPVPSPREGSVSYHRQEDARTGDGEAQVVIGSPPGDQQERFIFPLDSEQLVVHATNVEE